MSNISTPTPGTIIHQSALHPTTNTPLTITFKIIKFIVYGGWSAVNLVEILDVEGDGREVDEELRGMVGREVVWKKAVQDSMDKYDELAGHAGLRHPNIVELLAYWHDDPAPTQDAQPSEPSVRSTTRHILSVLLNPYLPTTLESLILPLPEPQALHVIKQLLQALTYLHSVSGSQGEEGYDFVLHRDLKASNILVEMSESERGEVGKVLLCDFGTSIKVVRNKEYPSVVGDLWIRAPELLSSTHSPLPYTPSIDIYSLGLLSFRLLLGRHLYERAIVEGRPDVGVQRRWVGEVLGEGGVEGERVRELLEREKSTVSVETIDLLGRMLAIDPERRVSAKEALKHVAFSRRDRES